MRKLRAVIAIAGSMTMGMLAAGPAWAQTPATACPPDGALSQPFTELGDDGWYFFAPGGDFESGPSWTTSGFATMGTWRSSNAYGGKRALLLDRASATSQAFCVDVTHTHLRLAAVAASDAAPLVIEAIVAGADPVVLGTLAPAGFTRWTYSPALPLASVLGLQPDTTTDVRLRVRTEGRWAFDAVAVDPYRH